MEARSVLNRVPSSSPIPFSWTVNPYRSCSKYLHLLPGRGDSADADGRSRPIGDLRAGDEVVGTVPTATSRRRFVRTRCWRIHHRRAQRWSSTTARCW
ncbi:hypothetical protein HBB16_18585 [Pseudonocardia sp. MCCB 268]|nr:hypothetical protein [Pseudonocardia cytotoxica]